MRPAPSVPIILISFIGGETICILNIRGNNGGWVIAAIIYMIAFALIAGLHLRARCR